MPLLCLCFASAACVLCCVHECTDHAFSPPASGVARSWTVSRACGSCLIKDYVDTIKYDRACAPLKHVFAIDLAIEISRLKYTSISGLYKMSVGGAKCRVYPEGAWSLYRAVNTALDFRRNVLKCLIALRHKGRLVLYGLWPY